MAQSTVDTWDRITSLATLGLGRHSSAMEDLLPDPAVKLPDGTREQWLLRCAAATLLTRLAGRRSVAAAVTLPARAAAVPEQAIPEPTIAEAALRRLARLFAEGPKELIGEWFACALKSQKVLPPQWIPPVFEALTPRMRLEYAPVFGERIHWLASQDARWTIEGIAKECSEDDWQTGSAAERIALLKRVRESDPGRGRTWLEATWSTDSAEAREAFVQALTIGLSSADEAFFEKALDDKRKGVRLAAAENLARLPESALVHRALTRLQPVFVFDPRPSGMLGRLTSRKLRIELPAALDKAALRDCIEPKPPADRKIGERSFWLMQMLSIPPPLVWLQRFDCSAAELLAAADRTDYAQEVFSALCTACMRHPDPEWVAALSAVWRTRGREQDLGAAAGIAALLAALPVTARDAQLQTEISALRSQDSVDLSLQLLTRSDHAWSPATTALAFDVLLTHIRESNGATAGLMRSQLESWGRHVEVAVAAPAAHRILEKIGPESPFRSTVERLLELIEFRIDMHKELLA
jgi:Family of unknown function (DUF5691)